MSTATSRPKFRVDPVSTCGVDKPCGFATWQAMRDDQLIVQVLAVQDVNPRGPISADPRSRVGLAHNRELEVDRMVQSAQQPERVLTIHPASFETDECVTNLFSAAAAKHLYDQECALHDAHTSGVAAWIIRAEQRLHTAILFYEAATLQPPLRSVVLTAAG
jgi:hypothetical protein